MFSKDMLKKLDGVVEEFSDSVWELDLNQKHGEFYRVTNDKSTVLITQDFNVAQQTVTMQNTFANLVESAKVLSDVLEQLNKLDSIVNSQNIEIPFWITEEAIERIVGDIHKIISSTEYKRLYEGR